MATEQLNKIQPLTGDDYFNDRGGFMWHHAINLVLAEWRETNKILRQLADFQAYKSYEKGLEDGKQEAEPSPPMRGESRD